MSLRDNPNIISDVSDLRRDLDELSLAVTNGGGGGGGGAVESVNGKTGIVTLNYADVHALSEDTEIPTIPTNVSAFTNDAGYAKTTELARVATTGNYSDLTNKPTIPTVPTNVSAFTNDAGYAKSADLATVATSGSYNDLSNKPTIPSAVTESTVAGWGFTKNTGTYSKPTTGIPKTDLASSVQTSLGKADTALQEHQSLADYAKTADLATVATSGKYSDLTGKPTIPSAAHNATITITQGGVTKGSFTTDQATNATIALDGGGGGTTNAVWGQITGTLSNQTDLKTELDSKVTAVAPGTPVGIDPDVTTNRIVDGAVTLPKLNKSDILNLFYPVGCYFETSNTAFNPNTSWGGTWVEDSAGKVLVAQNSGTFATVGATGGEETHTLTVSEIPSHRHSTTKAGSQGKAQAQTSGSSGYAWNADSGGRTGYEGGGGAHNNLQPYIVVKRWHRTA